MLNRKYEKWQPDYDRVKEIDCETLFVHFACLQLSIETEKILTRKKLSSEKKRYNGKESQRWQKKYFCRNFSARLSQWTRIAFNFQRKQKTQSNRIKKNAEWTREYAWTCAKVLNAPAHVSSLCFSPLFLTVFVQDDLKFDFFRSRDRRLFRSHSEHSRYNRNQIQWISIYHGEMTRRNFTQMETDEASLLDHPFAGSFRPFTSIFVSHRIFLIYFIFNDVETCSLALFIYSDIESFFLFWSKSI